MITNQNIRNLIRNNNILSGNLSKFGYQTFYDGKKLIAYKQPKTIHDFITNEMKIEKDNKTNMYFCLQILDNKEIEIFYHDKHFTTNNMTEEEKEIFRRIINR